MVFCPECGEKTHNNAKFCSNCGYSFENIENTVREERNLREDNIVREAHKPDLEGLDTLIIIGYVLAILGVFVSGILSIGGLILGIIIYRRGHFAANIYGLSVRTHGLIITLISIVTLIIGIAILIFVLSIFTTVFGFMNVGYIPNFPGY